MKDTVRDLARDFPDWLNPVLVKELRQGLKSRVFMISFVTVQIFLGLYLLISAIIYDTIIRRDLDISLEFTEWLFWVFVGAPLLVFLPVRGSSAIADESEGKKIDLLKLSQLGHARIVVGKWVAVNAASLLLVISVLPYMLARYFLGYNSVKDVCLLAVFCLLSVLFSSLLVGYSGTPAALRRLLMLAVLLGASILPHFTLPIFTSTEISNLFGGMPIGYERLLFLAGLSILVFYWLLFGIWQVGPKTGWLFLWKRLLVLLQVALTLTFLDLGKIWGFWALVFSLPLYAALLDVFSEPAFTSSSHASVVRRFPSFLRFAARALYPGWMWSVLFFTGVVVVGVGGVLVYMELNKSVLNEEVRNICFTLINSTVSVWFSFLSGSLLGNVILRKFFPAVLTIFLYQCVGLICGLILLNLMKQSVVAGSFWGPIVVFCPLSLLFYPRIDSSAYVQLGLNPSVVMAAGGVILLAIMHFAVGSVRRTMKALEDSVFKN